jgi:hypothetical protein
MLLHRHCHDTVHRAHDTGHQVEKLHDRKRSRAVLQRQEVRPSSYTTLQQPPPQEAKAVLTHQFHEATTQAQERFACDDFAEIQDGKLKLKRYDKVAVPAAVTTLQKVIEARLPMIRIERLLMDVDHLTHFSRHFTPVQGHAARPPHFYRTLLAALISQATNLGVVSMSASVQVSLSRFMVCCASHERRHHVWPIYGSPTCRSAPWSSWV